MSIVKRMSAHFGWGKLRDGVGLWCYKNDSHKRYGTWFLRLIVSSMFQEFSGGYYLGQFYIEPHDGDRAVMHREEHERANEQVYANGEGVERLDNPLVMKIDENHFPVHGADDVPWNTVALPAEFLERTRVMDPPALKEVLLAKAEKASMLLRWFCPGSGSLGQ